MLTGGYYLFKVVVLPVSGIRGNPEKAIRSGLIKSL